MADTLEEVNFIERFLARTYCCATMQALAKEKRVVLSLESELVLVLDGDMCCTANFCPGCGHKIKQEFNAADAVDVWNPTKG